MVRDRTADQTGTEAKAPYIEPKETVEGFDYGYKFLSNFYPCRIVWQGKEYPSAEHLYQALKTSDPEWRERIRTAKHPSAAKRLGKEVPTRPRWKEIRLIVMRMVLEAKFSDPMLQMMLIRTGDVRLVEYNTWHDHFWGVCDGEGENYLGKLLMEFRAKFGTLPY